jgi:hypothetical protein
MVQDRHCDGSGRDGARRDGDGADRKVDGADRKVDGADRKVDGTDRKVSQSTRGDPANKKSRRACEGVRVCGVRM